MTELFFTHINPIPLDTWIVGRHNISDADNIVLSCKKGCCVHSELGCMVLPRYWRYATDSEITVEKERLAAIKPIDMSELYVD